MRQPFLPAQQDGLLQVLLLLPEGVAGRANREPPPLGQQQEEAEGGAAASAGGGCPDAHPHGPCSSTPSRVLAPLCRSSSVLRVHRPSCDWDPACPCWARSGMARSPLTPSRPLLGEAGPSAYLGLPRPGGPGSCPHTGGHALTAVELCPQQCSCAKELVPSQHAVLDLTNLPTKLNRGGRS